jgi:hypothetical protein
MGIQPTIWITLWRSMGTSHQIGQKDFISLLKEQNERLSDESLLTLFCEVEAILNSRPITNRSDDINDLEALTPNHILLLRPGQDLPCGVFDSRDNYVRRRWRQVQ